MVHVSRRALLRACGVVASSLTAGCGAIRGDRFASNCANGRIRTGPARAGGDPRWPQFAADAGNSGATADPGPERGALAWRFATCHPMRGTSPIAADGTVFVTMIGDSGTRAFDAATGKERWSAAFTSRSPEPAFADGTLFVAGHGLRAFDAADGAVEWTFERPDRASAACDDGVDRPGPIRSAPAVVDGVVYVPGGFGVPWLYALDTADGTVQWRRRLPGSDLITSPAVEPPAVYVVDDADRLVAIDRAVGTVRWARAGFGAPIGTPVVAGGRVIVVDADRGVHALDRDGKPVWRADVTGGHGPPAVDGDRAYVACGTEVAAIDLESGEVRWTRDFGRGSGLGVPVVADGTVYVGRRGGWVEGTGGSEARGSILAVDAVTGEDAWTLPTRGIPAGEGGPYAGTDGSLAVGDGMLFACTDAGDLYAIGDTG